MCVFVRVCEASVHLCQFVQLCVRVCECVRVYSHAHVYEHMGVLCLCVGVIACTGV